MNFKNMEPRQKWMIVLLGLLLVYLPIDLLMNWDDYSVAYGFSEAPPMIAESDSIDAANNTAVDSVRITSDFAYEGEWHRDPFFGGIQRVSRSGAPKQRRPSLKLFGVSPGSSETDALAVINGEILAVGDRVLTYKVEKILVDRVVLRNSEKLKTLWLE